jgi:hypothetical protein
MGKLEDAQELGYGTYLGQIGILHQLPESKGTPSSMQGSLSLLQIWLGRNVMLLGDTGVTELIIQGAVVDHGY